MSSFLGGGGGGGSTGANPTATASNIAVNGVATTFMRSDAAPAVQLCSAAQFGLCEVDGSTITAAGGVISVAGGAGTVNSVTANDTTLTISPNTGAVLAQINLARANHWTDTTDSSSTGTGAIITDGGVGIAKTTWIGGNINLPHAAATSTTGNIIFGGGIPLIFYGGKNVGGRPSIFIVETANYTADPAGNAGNVIVGAQGAGSALTSGWGNIVLGSGAFGAATTDNNCFGLGRNALASANGGNSNLAIGSQALQQLTTGDHNTCIGPSGAGFAYTSTEAQNTIIGFDQGVVGESAIISIATGAFNASKLDWNRTTAGHWTMAGNLTIPALSTAGVLVNDSSGNVSSDSTAAAATVSAAFIADHRLAVTIGVTTYYIAMSTTAW